MSLSFQNFEDNFTAPRRSFEGPNTPDDLKDENATFTIFLGQLLFDIYYGFQQPPAGSPMLKARWDRQRQQLSEELKADSFTLPVEWAKALYEQLSNPEDWQKTLIYPTVTFKDGTSKEIQLNQAGASLFTRAIERVVNQLLDYFEPKASEVLDTAHAHDDHSSCGGFIMIQ